MCTAMRLGPGRCTSHSTSWCRAYACVAPGVLEAQAWRSILTQLACLASQSHKQQVMSCKRTVCLKPLHVCNVQGRAAKCRPKTPGWVFPMLHASEQKHSQQSVHCLCLVSSSTHRHTLLSQRAAPDHKKPQYAAQDSRLHQPRTVARRGEPRSKRHDSMWSQRCCARPQPAQCSSWTRWRRTTRCGVCSRAGSVSGTTAQLAPAGSLWIPVLRRKRPLLGYRSRPLSKAAMHDGEPAAAFQDARKGGRRHCRRARG